MSKLLLPLLLLSLTASAQPAALRSEEWAEHPALHTVDARYSKEPAVILLDRRRVEYVDNPDNTVSAYRTLHRIVHINDDHGIEYFNKIYLGVTDSSSIVDVRARSIFPNGKIIAIDKKNIKSIQEEDGNRYNIFAMEGLEKGCEVEYTYTFLEDISFFGRETMQTIFPTLDAQFDLLAPPRLIFQMKGYNCNVSVSDTTLNGKRTFSTRLLDIPGAEKEKYSTYDANLQRIEFRLSYNTSNDKEHVRLNTWSLLAQHTHDRYETFTEKEQKTAGELIEANGWSKLPTPQAKIIAVENWLKEHISTRKDIDMDKADKLEWIIKNKIASHQGLMRLFCALYQGLGIDHEIVLAASREESVIDKNFENWNNAGSILLYFPATKKFLAPTLPQLRYPWIDPWWGAADGLFCKTTTIGSYSTALATIKRIPLEDYTQSYGRLDATLRLNASLDTVLTDMAESFGGYNALGPRTDFILSNQEERQAVIKDIARQCTNSETITSSKIEGNDFASYSDNKPVVIRVSIKAEGLLESAGNKLLVKVGMIIGPQVEMYQEKARQFPMDIAFPHTLERDIDFIIPEGYTVKNPGDAAIHHEFSADGNIAAGFTSTYTLEGSHLKIHVLEQYRLPTYPLSAYEDFKKVINASADFNKITFILEKAK
ncbi:DUF3857 domain-containing protein [Puia dinghuensis]|uniref:DUF3857 domain-containing protein n=1 Tax=Puia dinghuensis TaxID=1792502 RepID=A0A8J2U5Y0_9BACT|nr:DUF3857 domain-containing protein [Puia dinghuensis]GGA81280.1 hypothetical protein GCM10011511_00290 [Puia dinghuensis]